MAAVCTVLATAALLSGCFDQDFGGGDMTAINDDGVAVGSIRARDEVGNVRSETVAIDTETGKRTVFEAPAGWRYGTPIPTGIADDGMVVARGLGGLPAGRLPLVARHRGGRARAPGPVRDHLPRHRLGRRHRRRLRL